jgi:tetratricopeptide (TPR) repeat protein
VDPDAPPGTLTANLKLTVHTIYLKKVHEGPELTQSGSLQDLSQMETKLAWLLLRQLNPATAPKEEDFTRDRPPVKVEAMESYVRGLMTANADQKMKLFSQAVRIDEHFSQPNFQLGKMLFAKKEFRTAGQWLSKVTKSDSHYLEAGFLRAICRYYDGDFNGAAEQFRQVAAEIPLNEVYNNLGAALSRKNDPTAMENFSKALEGDEADPDYWFNVGYFLWKQGQFSLATEKFRAVLDRTPDDQEATTFLGRCIRMDGPHSGDARTEGRERIKTAFEDSAWRQLQAELRSK